LSLAARRSTSTPLVLSLSPNPTRPTFPRAPLRVPSSTPLARTVVSAPGPMATASLLALPAMPLLLLTAVAVLPLPLSGRSSLLRRMPPSLLATSTIALVSTLLLCLSTLLLPSPLGSTFKSLVE